MKYILYTLPSCQDCVKTKKFLDGRKINYEEINAGIGKGKQRFRELFKNYRKHIEREQGQIIFPILVADSHISQGLDGIISSL